MKLSISAMVVGLFVLTNGMATNTRAFNVTKECIYIPEEISVFKGDEKRPLEKLFKIELISNKVVITALIPLEKIKDPVYLNVLSARSEILIHQLIADPITEINLKDFKKGEYFVEVSRDDEKMVKHLSWK